MIGQPVESSAMQAEGVGLIEIEPFDSPHGEQTVDGKPKAHDPRGRIVARMRWIEPVKVSTGVMDEAHQSFRLL